ncbi:MAG: tRNA (guanosine(46)-N7)-methyltransferase TrmB [Clostridia bacterium]|nr:tRNA (guanosine(46)-N7)-methyltransferase TrmB [Clostridia bacterium]
MRMRRKPWARPELAVCKFFVHNPEEAKGNWKDLFCNKQPLHLELGCGKGVFTAEIARKNPNINYIAIDINSDVLAVARRNIVALFDGDPDNLLLTARNIDTIDGIISPEDTIERIYINFCNPWPKKKHKKRRLTYPTKLELYKKFLIKGGEIHFKTDDDELFEDSLDYFKESGFKVTNISYDLHSEDKGGNILTEHEKMFSEQGIKIKSCIAAYI